MTTGGTIYIDKMNPPSQVVELIDAIRQIGNISAHAFENDISGEIIEVEPEEAELCLSILHLMFDYHFVKPNWAKRIIEQTNNKLQSAGKNVIKLK